MKKLVLLCALCIGAGFTWGAATAAFRIFPFYQIKSFLPQERSALQDEAQKLFSVYPRKGEVAIVGDSIFDELNWQDALPEYDVVQRTIGGSTSAHVRDGLSAIKNISPRVTVLLIGTNDIGRGIPQSETLSNVGAIRDAIPGRLIVVSVPPCSAKSVHCPTRMPKIRSLNAALSRLDRIEFLDIQGDILGEDIVDGTHLTASGIVKIVDKVRDRISQP